jgi:hypothetical protein
MPQKYGSEIAALETDAALCGQGLGKEMLESLIEEAETLIADIKRKVIQ